MAYSSAGLIEATDYNNFLNGSNKLNTVWASGTGNAGYGQTALSTVSAGGTVTATQWATLINTLNSILVHQSGAGSGISATTAGSTINYLSTLATAINTAYTNRLNKSAGQGTTITGGTYSPNFTSASTAAAQTWSFTRTITFGSANAARYFFNAGGYLNFITTSVANNNGQGRSADWVTLIGTNFANLTGLRHNANDGRSGTLGTLNTNNTGLGYYNLTTSGQTAVQVTSTGYPYSGDYVYCNLRSDANPGGVIYLDFVVYSGALQSDFGNKAINVTWNHRIDIIPPESTNLSNTWGTPTIS